MLVRPLAERVTWRVVPGTDVLVILATTLPEIVPEGWAVTGYLTLLLEPDCGIEDGELGIKLIGGLVEMRMLTSGERNI